MRDTALFGEVYGLTGGSACSEVEEGHDEHNEDEMEKGNRKDQDREGFGMTDRKKL